MGIKRDHSQHIPLSSKVHLPVTLAILHPLISESNRSRQNYAEGGSLSMFPWVLSCREDQHTNSKDIWPETPPELGRYCGRWYHQTIDPASVSEVLEMWPVWARCEGAHWPDRVTYMSGGCSPLLLQRSTTHQSEIYRPYLTSTVRLGSAIHAAVVFHI